MCPQHTATAGGATSDAQLSLPGVAADKSEPRRRDTEIMLAAMLVQRANVRLGTNWSTRADSPAMQRARARIKQHGQLGREILLAIVDDVTERKWWDGRPHPGVVFGAGVWDRRAGQVQPDLSPAEFARTFNGS